MKLQLEIQCRDICNKTRQKVATKSKNTAVLYASASSCQNVHLTILIMGVYIKCMTK